MTEELAFILSTADDSMKKAINHLETELIKIRAGKANPQMIDGIMVDYYGSPMPINQVANISVMDARTLSIQPWEKNMLQPIERAIIAANIGITPQNDGALIRLFLPPLTEERRKELVEAIKRLSEREQLVLSLYYEEDATLKEIAAILDVSIARVSQIHGRAIAKIRGYIEEANQE